MLAGFNQKQKKNTQANALQIDLERCYLNRHRASVSASGSYAHFFLIFPQIEFAMCGRRTKLDKIQIYVTVFKLLKALNKKKEYIYICILSSAVTANERE